MCALVFQVIVGAMPPAAPAIPAAAPVAPAAPHRGAQPRDAGTTATLTPTVQPVPTPTDQPTATTGPGSANPTTPCFPAETLVATSHGLQAIQTLQVGQLVLSEDPATHNVEAEAVQAVIADSVSPLMAVR